jgi:hypothetical protein
MALPVFVALVSDAPSLGISELTIVAAAIQKQVARDLSQHWGIQGTVSPFARLEDVPAGFWPVIVRDDIEEDAAGTHCDDHGQPMALVTSDPAWSVTASHEVLEMLVDPFGNRVVAGQSPKADQGRVEFLVEVADPVGDSVYTVDGVKVSDFCTPRYFDPQPSAGVQYCATGAIQGPRQILVDGYLTWHDPVGNEWWQQSRFGGEDAIVSLGPLLKTACGMRTVVDPLAARRRREQSRPPEIATAEAPARGVVDPRHVASSRAKAEAWRALIGRIHESCRARRT